MTTKTASPLSKYLTPVYKECSKCLFTEDIAKIGEDGVCSYCKLQDQLRANANPDEWPAVLERIKNSGVENRYDCLIGISGGEDSSILLYLAVREWGLRPLVIHFNNRTNRPQADNNIRLLTRILNVNFIEYFPDQMEYDAICDSFLMAGVQDADLANDVAMSKLMYVAARDHGIKYILNGHSFKYEGSSPKAWSLIDGTYLKSIYEKWTGNKLKNYPLYTVWDQVWSGILGIKQVRPFHYSDHDRKKILATLISIGWQDYGGKHNENIHTAFIGSCLLPRKFGIDKRRTYLSAQIREGLISKEYAKEILLTPPEFNLNDLGERRERILSLMNSYPVGSRSSYKITNFKKWKVLFFILMKVGVFPSTAYAKYCR